MNELPRTFKIVTFWLLVGVAVFLAVLWFDSAQNKANFSVNGNAIEIRRGRDGHYHWDGEINGQSVSFLVDTGASVTCIPESIARQANLRVIGTATFSTANGDSQNDIVRGNLTLEGGVEMRNLRMSVLPENSDLALLGMDVISKLHMTQTDGVIRFERN